MWLFLCAATVQRQRLFVEVFNNAIGAQVKFFHRAEELGVGFIAVADDPFIGVTVRRIGAFLCRIVIRVAKPMPADTDTRLSLIHI